MILIDFRLYKLYISLNMLFLLSLIARFKLFLYSTMAIKCQLILLVDFIRKNITVSHYTFTINSIDSRQADGFQFA